MSEQRDEGSRTERGFSPTELLVAIAVLGILAVAVVFGALAIGQRHESGACQTEVGSVNNAIDEFYAKADPPAYPTRGSVRDLDEALRKAHAFKKRTPIPNATAKYKPKYDPATGTFSATCP